MRELEWGRIAKLQDELVRQEDQRKRQRQTYHKFLYKQQLQSMMSEKSRKQREMAESQRKKHIEAYRSLEMQDNERQQFEKRAKLQLLLKENSEYNYNSVRNRKSRLRSELQEDQTFHRDKYRKAETERSEEREAQSLQRMKRKRELAQAYEQQINSHTSRKHLQKLEDERFEQLAYELQNKKEIQRQNHINKIKYGFSQNPQTYETIRQIYNKKEEMKQAFLRKLQIEKFPTEESTYRKKSLQTIQASNFNRNYSMLRERSKKEQEVREAQEESRKLCNIQQQLRLEMHQQRLLRQGKRRQLKEDLQSQMNQAAQRKLSWQKMSDNEHRINQPYLKLLQPISIPGLARDHRELKKQQIIDQFLKNKSAFSYASP